MLKGYFSGSLKISAFIIKKDYLFVSIWTLVLLFIAGIMLISFENQFTLEELQGLLIMKDNPAHVALQGPFFATKSFLAGHFYAVEMHLFTLIAVAILNIFLVMRNTRGDEEKGRYEVLRSLPVGRLAPFNATMIVVLVVNFILAASHGILLSLLNIGGITTTGAFAYGISLGVTGILFAAISALLSQLSHSTRTVTAYAFFVVIASYLLRALGDVAFIFLSFISPLGLPLRAEIFVTNKMWPFAVMLVIAFIIFAVAYLLNAKRDIGQGLLPEKQGRNYASAFLKTPLGLIWRQTRNTLFAWAVGIFGFGAALGGILRDAEHFAGESGAFRMLMPSGADFSAIELFTMFLNAAFAIVCIAPALVLIFKVLSEEREGYAEPVLSGAVSRISYLACFAGIAFAASIIMPSVTIVGLWAVSSVMLEVPLTFTATLHSIMVYIPAIWVMLGLGIFAVGAVPKLAVVCWAHFTYIFIVGFFGDLLNMPKWAMNFSPFYHVPQLPLESFCALTFVLLTLLAMVLASLGFVFFRQRSIRT